MDITYNRAPTAIFSLKISAMAKLIYERMYVISKEGTQVIFFKQVDYSEFFNVSRMTIFRAVNELLECKLLELAEPAKKVPFDQTKYYKINEPKVDTENKSNNEQKTAETVDTVQCTEIVQSNVQQLDNRMSNNCTLSMYNSDTLECTTPVHCQCTTSVHSSLDKKSKDYISKDKVREAKRSASALSSFSSYYDFMPLFTQLADELKDEHLAIGRMYLPTTVEKFFNHYQSRNFRWKHGLNADAREWLLNECTHIECNLLRDTKSEQLAEQQQRANKTNEWIDREAELKGIKPEEVRQQFLDYYHAAINGPTDEQKLLSDFLGVSVDKLTHNQGVVINEH